MIEQLELWWQRWVALPRPPGKLDSLLACLYRVTRFNGVPLQPALPTISIGGLTVGGAGKTPLTIWLTRRLLADYKVAVVSRGYRRASAGQVVVSQGQGPMISSAMAGDEPWLIARRCPQAIVICDRNRAAAVLQAKAMGADIVVLDDGFQHRRLARALDIVCIAQTELQVPYRPFPLGRWREPLSALQRAAAVVVFDVEHGTTDSNRYQHLIPGLSLRARPFFARWRNVQGDATEAPAPGLNIAVCAAIARPERFITMLQQSGYVIHGTLLGADHRGFSTDKLIRWCREMKQNGAQAVVTTEKDYVKGLPALSLPVIYPELELHIDSQDQLLNMIWRQVDVQR